MSRRIGAAGLEIIKRFETLRLHAHLPTADDVPTIGWGHTKGVQMGDTCTIAEADAWLAEDCREAENAVNGGVLLPITHNQFDALVSFTFNVGIGAFWKSTLRRKLNFGDYAGAAAEFPRWNRQKGKVLKGLTLRREAEKKLFLTPAESYDVHDDS